MSEVHSLSEKAFGGQVLEIQAPLFTTTRGEGRGVKIVVDWQAQISLLQMTLFRRRVFLRKEIERLLEHAGVIVLEGHSLPPAEEQAITQQMPSMPEDSGHWHGDVYDCINILHRRGSDPERVHPTCFTTSSYIHERLLTIWPQLQERIERQRPQDPVRDSLAALDVGYLNQAMTAGIDERRSVEHVLDALRFAQFNDKTIVKDTFLSLNEHIDFRYVLEYPWTGTATQSVIFWNSTKVSKSTSDILHASRHALGVGNDGAAIRRKIVGHRK